MWLFVLYLEENSHFYILRGSCQRQEERSAAMCSIMGYEGKDTCFEKFMEGFERSVPRGPDMSRVIETDGGILGFHRLAIMDPGEAGMQPFERDGD